MALIESRFRLLYAALFTVFALFGTSITVVGATLPRILSTFGWNYTAAGAVLAAASVGAFIATYAAGRLIARLGPRRSIMIGLLFDALGLAFFALSPSILTNLLLYLAVGVGQGFIEVSVNWSVVRMSGRGEGRAMSLMHGAFSIGAVAGPLLVGILGGTGLPWTAIYRGIAVLVGILCLLMLPLPFERLGREAGEDARAARNELRRSPAYFLGFVALFLYVGTELGISNWSAEYFVKVFGASPETGAFMVSLFWAGLLGGRFGFPLVFPRARQDRLLLGLSLFLSVSVGALFAAGVAGPAAVALGVVAVLASGLGASAIYPIVITLVGGAFPEAQGEALGFAATGGGVGSFLFPFLMAAIAGRFGLLAGFGFYAATAILSATAAFALTAAVRSRKAARGA